MPPNAQQSWQAERAAINMALQSSSLTPAQLAEVSGVGYYAAWRALNRGVTNRTQSAIRIAQALQVLTPESPLPQIQSSDWCTKLLELCDGTDDHARLILELAEAVARYDVTARNRNGR